MMRQGVQFGEAGFGFEGIVFVDPLSSLWFKAVVRIQYLIWFL